MGRKIVTNNTNASQRPLKYAWYYSSNRIRPAAAEPATVTSKPLPQRTTVPRLHPVRMLGLVMLLVILGFTFFGQQVDTFITKKTRQRAAMPTITTPIVAGACNGNSLSQLILVSISRRHLWACSGVSIIYDAPVVTGMAQLAADATPTGMYRIYAKESNLHLTGSDSTGSWNDYVHYWLPFLSNQYGQYGFHDATWRSNEAFGNISPDSRNGSHGCVETPLVTAKWLYGWAQVGTTVKIVS